MGISLLIWPLLAYLTHIYLQLKVGRHMGPLAIWPAETRACIFPVKVQHVYGCFHKLTFSPQPDVGSLICPRHHKLRQAKIANFSYFSPINSTNHPQKPLPDVYFPSVPQVCMCEITFLVCMCRLFPWDCTRCLHSHVPHQNFQRKKSHPHLM
jgi:hypothetical protein